MFQTKAVDKIQTHILCSVIFFPPENRACFQIMWKNIVERGRPQMTIWPMRIACWIPKATNTPSEYAILIALTLQHRLHDRASMLRYNTLPVLCFGVDSPSVSLAMHFHSPCSFKLI